MSLELYSRNRWIRKHRTSPEELARLLAIADRDIEQSQTPGLGTEWCFDIAYNAALQLATAALAAAGYRAERTNKHMRTLECLEFTLELDEASVGVLDAFRRKRHTAVYDQIGMISDHEAAEMVAMARRLRREVEDRLREHHPDLMPSMRSSRGAGERCHVSRRSRSSGRNVHAGSRQDRDPREVWCP